MLVLLRIQIPGFDVSFLSVRVRVDVAGPLQAVLRLDTLLGPRVVRHGRSFCEHESSAPCSSVRRIRRLEAVKPCWRLSGRSTADALKGRMAR